jgi:hypothetical protein
MESEKADIAGDGCGESKGPGASFLSFKCNAGGSLGPIFDSLFKSAFMDGDAGPLSSNEGKNVVIGRRDNLGALGWVTGGTGDAGERSLKESRLIDFSSSGLSYFPSPFLLRRHPKMKAPRMRKIIRTPPPMIAA